MAGMSPELQPNLLTYSAAIRACGIEKRWKEAMAVFERMQVTHRHRLTGSQPHIGRRTKAATPLTSWSTASPALLLPVLGPPG